VRSSHAPVPPSCLSHPRAIPDQRACAVPPTAGSLRAIYGDNELHGAIPFSDKLPAFDPAKKFTAADVSALVTSLADLILFVPANFFYEEGEIPAGLLGYTAKVVGSNFTDKKNNPSLTLLFFDDEASFYLYPHPRAKKKNTHLYLSSKEVKVLA